MHTVNPDPSQSLRPLSRSEQDRLFDQAGSDDSELRTHLHTLIENHSIAMTFVRRLLDRLGGRDPIKTSTTFSVGEVIAERFQIVAFLGEGGMGEVYEAEDLVLRGEHVALKTVQPIVSADEEALGRLKL